MSDLALEPQAPVEATPEPVEPSWEGPTQEAWEQTQAELNWFREQAARTEEPQPDYSQYDPFNEQFPQQFAQMAQQLEQFNAFMQQAQGRESEERFLDIVEIDIERNGDLPGGDKAIPFIRSNADQLYSEMARKYGNGSRAAEEAILQASSNWRAFAGELQRQGIEQNNNQLSTIANAPREPGAGGASPAGQLSVAPRTTQELLQKYLGN